MPQLTDPDASTPNGLRAAIDGCADRPRRIHNTLRRAVLNVIWLMPLLVRLQFGSPDPASATKRSPSRAAIPTFMTLSIF